MDNSFKLNEKRGYTNIINKNNSAINCLELDRILLDAGEKLEHEFTDVESIFILQNGDFTARVESKGGDVLDNIGGLRTNIFDELPVAVYIPPYSKLNIETRTGLDSFLYSSPCTETGPPVYLKPDEIVETIKGTFNWKRKFRLIFGPQSETNNLIMGESVSVPGGWIGFPPHKHDIESGDEYPLDEIYVLKVSGPHGAYAIHHTYDKEKKTEEYYTIDEDLAIAIPRGFHTSLAVPGCRLYMLWVLAGKKKIYKISFDERFKWLNDVDSLF